MKKLLLALLFASCSASAEELPSWFANSLMHLPEDVAEAAKSGKRVMLYFGQDGCPYCTRLIDVNFRQRMTVDRMAKRFVALAINIWGDREVTWIDGKTRTEKQLAAHLKVQFTPTLIFLDEKGGIALRVNGYYAPRRFNAALDHASGGTTLADLQQESFSPDASATLNEQPFFTDKRSGKPLVLVFETTRCAECDTLHRDVFSRPEVLDQLRKFDVMRFRVPSAEAKKHKVDFVPTMVLLDAKGREAIRLETYFRPFHVTGALDYVASGAFRKEPSFQRFLQAKADRLKTQGTVVDLWK